MPHIFSQQMSPASKHSNEKQQDPFCGSPGEDYCFSSPLGYINVTACADGLHSVGLEGNISDENFSPNEKYCNFNYGNLRL